MTPPALPDAIRTFLPEAPVTLVTPTRPDTDAIAAGLSVADLFPDGAGDVDAARACLAGVLLLRDAADRAHGECQDLDTAEGAYWHGILHRREPDAGNAKYWMRRVGRHPIHETLSGGALPPAHAELFTTGGRWDAARFVDACCAPRIAPGMRTVLEAVQWREALLLLAHGAGLARGDRR